MSFDLIATEYVREIQVNSVRWLEFSECDLRRGIANMKEEFRFAEFGILVCIAG